ncbi:hypothetical protein J2W30_004429 [Variovorax boronicumulans]|uniref:hypothetical protein n=1 Tax=Variovorax boronicumulans TaxID=436515 RepID=UPI00277D5A0E|nr:hypothetical protein [Variovorax boronicumulans]MDP9993884.1 hypothetical protein [Variovorax boronicumulans]MDQ0005253.1 hypothetical protein [Variovorax boronicumulans]MDQ0036654.1 hypothetical protein [Variovorax boronicumulans]
MPYTYLIFRAKRPVQVGSQVDEADVTPIGTSKEIRALFHAVIPELTWDDTGDAGYYKVGDEEFIVSLFEQGPIHMAVSATGHSPRGFQGYLIEICAAAGLFAVDDGLVLGGMLRL